MATSSGETVPVPRPSPQTTRVIDTIDLLTDAEDGLTLSEIARELPANVSSCVHLLAALTASGWVVRDAESKRYRVGPALVGPGRRAAERHPVLTVLRDEMSTLTDETGLPVLAFRRDGPATVPDGEHELARLIAMTWPRREGAPGVRIGDTVPIVAPLGALFTAWQSDDEIRRWLDTIGEPVHRDRLADDLAIIREAGYSVERDLQAASNEDLEALVDGRPSPYRDRLLYGVLAGHGDDARVLTDLERSEEHVVHGICAPVRVDDEVVIGMYVVGFRGPLPAQQIAAWGAATRRAAARTTDRLCTLQKVEPA